MKLNKILLGSLFVVTSVFAGSNTVHWGYTGHNNPEHWGEFDKANFMCKEGKNQSPINIANSIEVHTKDLTPIKFNYNSGSSSIVDNGHTIEIMIKKGSSIQIDGKTFYLKQFHFHSPSENEINGKHFPLEAHFVNVAKDGSIAVVAILFEDGKTNPLIEKLWTKMPHIEGDENKIAVTAKEISDFLPKDKAYYRFDGSLTTPPCSEGVRWFVFKAYDTVSKAQVKEFTQTMHHADNRPVQAINARKVLY
jgi:carbonic anhydrase